MLVKITEIHSHDAYYSTREKYVGKIFEVIDIEKSSHYSGWNKLQWRRPGEEAIHFFIAVKLKVVKEKNMKAEPRTIMMIESCVDYWVDENTKKIVPRPGDHLQKEMVESNESSWFIDLTRKGLDYDVKKSFWGKVQYYYVKEIETE